MSEERRQHPRFSVQLQSAFGMEGDKAAARTRDVSRGGICFVTDQVVERGTIIPIYLTLALGPNAFSEAIELPARVVWCTPVSLATPPEGSDDDAAAGASAEAYQIGAAFHDLSYHQIGELEMFLRFLQREFLIDGDSEEPTTNESGFDISDRQAAAAEDAEDV